MKARIYRPSPSVTQSGAAIYDKWVLEFEPAKPRTIDPIMGWTSTKDANSQIKLSFDSLDEAKAYADRKGVPYDVKREKTKRRHMQTYADNFK